MMRSMSRFDGNGSNDRFWSVNWLCDNDGLWSDEGLLPEDGLWSAHRFGDDHGFWPQEHRGSRRLEDDDFGLRKSDFLDAGLGSVGLGLVERAISVPPPVFRDLVVFEFADVER